MAQRAEGAKYRGRQEDRYREQLTAASVDYLHFAPEHGELAADIAAKAAGRAGEVGSGRVGRTRTLTLEERAELAARAHIRHHHTSYHDAVAELPIEAALFGDDWLPRGEGHRTARGRRLPRAAPPALGLKVIRHPPSANRHPPPATCHLRAPATCHRTPVDRSARQCAGKAAACRAQIGHSPSRRPAAAGTRSPEIMDSPVWAHG
jgi:hypothetical protein